MKIIIVEPGSIPKESKELLESKGVVIIEHANPDAVRILNFESKVFTNDLLMSALEAVEHGISTHERFVKELNTRLKNKEAEKFKSQDKPGRELEVKTI